MTPHRLLCVVALGVVLAVPSRPTTAQQDSTLPPVGLGTLRQDDIAVRIDAGDVLVRIIPLDERLLRLLASDSYSSLASLRRAHAAEIAEAGARAVVDRPSVFLVTMFGVEDQVMFDPERLTVTSRNRLFRPIAILARSPQWHQNRLSQRETATALYVFEDGIEIFEPFTVEYAGLRSDRWAQTLRRVERERARIANRGEQLSAFSYQRSAWTGSRSVLDDADPIHE